MYVQTHAVMERSLPRRALALVLEWDQEWEPCAGMAVAKEHRAPSLTSPVRLSLPWRVLEVTALPGYQLSVQFVDGLGGIVDMSALVRSSKAGVFGRLRSRDLFEQVGVDHWAVTSRGERDLAPDAVYAAIKEHGSQTLFGELEYGNRGRHRLPPPRPSFVRRRS